MTILKNKLKTVAKQLLGENLKISKTTYNPKNSTKALEEYINNYPDSISNYKKIGRRRDRKEFYPAVKKIEDGYNLLYRDLHKYDSNGVTELIEYSSVRSGTPMRTKPFPMCREYAIRMLMSKYLYRYPAISDKSLGCQNFINYLVREGFELEKCDGYDGLGVDNIVFTYSTTHAFNMIIQTLCKPEDVVIMTGPNYGLFAVEPEKIDARVEILDLSPEDNWYVNPQKLDKKIDDIKALDIFDYECNKIKRVMDEVYIDSLVTKDKIVGFRNGCYELSKIDYPLFDSEGVYYKNFFGTHVLGPILVRNPLFLKYFMNKLTNKKLKYDLKLEQLAYDTFVNNFKINS